MIYVDTSVLLSALLVEDHCPPRSFWSETLVTSRLADYEVWIRLHARKVVPSCIEEGVRMLGRLRHVELDTSVLDRLREPLPTVVRTLNAIHLASALFVASHAGPTRLATYDRRLARAAEACGLEAYEP